MKIYNFSQNKFLTKIQDAELEARFEVVENTGLSVEEVLSQKIDIIEIAPNDFDQFKEHVMAVDWKTSQLGMAD
ncbi:MAG: hypothetical protein ACXVAX_13020, partial [Pseudobdellovibrio sp.]